MLVAGLRELLHYTRDLPIKCSTFDIRVSCSVFFADIIPMLCWLYNALVLVHNWDLPSLPLSTYKSLRRR